jgi:nucleoside-diphosphate-sugar epimerase
MNPQFRVIIIGGTGQVGSAVVQALLAESVCREVVMVTRKPVVIADPARLRNVVMETGAADFEMRVADLAREVVASGERVSAVSCVGVGSGSLHWTEEQLKQLEIGVVGAFARGVRQVRIPLIVNADSTRS